MSRKIIIPAHLRESCTEGIFNPKQNEHFDPNMLSLGKMLKRSLKSCALDARQELCSNVLLMGEYANLEGSDLFVFFTVTQFQVLTDLVEHDIRLQCVF